MKNQSSPTAYQRTSSIMLSRGITRLRGTKILFMLQNTPGIFKMRIILVKAIWIYWSFLLQEIQAKTLPVLTFSRYKGNPSDYSLRVIFIIIMLALRCFTDFSLIISLFFCCFFAVFSRYRMINRLSHTCHIYAITLALR